MLLRTSFQIILEGIRGSTPLSDVAIDDISIHFGTCSGDVKHFTTDSIKHHSPRFCISGGAEYPDLSAMQNKHVL